MTIRQLVKALQDLVESGVSPNQIVLITINTRRGPRYTIFTDVESVEVRNGLPHIVTLDWRHGE